MAFAVPRPANAFWLFSALLPSAQADTSASVVPDASLSVLSAATNSDPNPAKGGNSVALTTGSALIADQGPEGNPDIEVTPKNGAISNYIVQNGDTLSEIASKFSVTQKTILGANDLKSAKDIHPGDSLVILPISGIQHTVVKGETLASLAKKYGANADNIASYNGIDSSGSLEVGSALLIPNGEVSVSAPSTTKPSGTKKPVISVRQGGSLANVQANPYRGGSGAPLPGYFGNPLTGGLITQGIHGWNGVDIGAHTGTPVVAAAAGTVIVSKASGWNGGYGSYVVVSHSNGTQTLYAHFSRVNVSVGDTVAEGQLLGAVGMTGDATGPHLHFEVRGAANPFHGCTVDTVCTPE